MSIYHGEGIAVCSACGAVLGQEEIDFETCFACGGKGLGFDDEDDNHDDGFNPYGSGPVPIGPREE